MREDKQHFPKCFQSLESGQYRRMYLVWVLNQYPFHKVKESKWGSNRNKSLLEMHPICCVYVIKSIGDRTSQWHIFFKPWEVKRFNCIHLYGLDHHVVNFLKENKRITVWKVHTAAALPDVTIIFKFLILRTVVLGVCFSCQSLKSHLQR